MFVFKDVDGSMASPDRPISSDCTRELDLFVYYVFKILLTGLEKEDGSYIIDFFGECEKIITKFKPNGNCTLRPRLRSLEKFEASTKLPARI